MKAIRIIAWCCLLAALTSGAALADGRQVRGTLSGLQEVPAVSTTGHGVFQGTFSVDGGALTYALSYADLQADVAQAHIHFAQAGVNGGVAVFLCTNLGNGPPATQACPAAPATISGTVTAADVLGPGVQGIQGGEWEELKRAIRRGATYVNVHSTQFPGGEIRGQLRVNEGRAD